jgi:Carboxypeptidase regulatory-like domain/TonB dependent receptor
MLKLVGTLLLLAAGFASVAPAQSLYGSLVGSVTDDSGAAVPHANVTAKQAETNFSRSTLTDESGRYNVPDLLPGTYQLTVTVPGFETFTERNVNIEANQAIRLDARLKVGQASEAVTVSATAVALQTETAAVQSNTTSEQLVDVPTSGHSWQTTAAMMPGVAQPDYIQSGGSNNPTRSLGFSVNGEPTSNTVIRLDGITQLNQYFQGISVYTPGTEAIETVSIVTSSFGADQGMAGAASANVQVKSGTNQLHGSAFDHTTDYLWKARNFFLPPQDPKGTGSTQIYGGTVGGPIKKNKLFYFGSVERTRQRAYAGDPLSNIGSNGLVSLPSAAMRTGDFSATGSTLYDPGTGNSSTGTGRTPFPNDMIPLSRISPISTAILQDLQLPNLPGFTNNYYSTTDYITNYAKYDGKMTWVASSKTTINGRVGIGTSYELGSGQLPSIVPNCTPISGAPFCPNPLQGGRYWITTVRSYSVAATHVFSPTFLLDGAFGVTTSNMVAYTDSPECWGAVFGIPNTCPAPYSKSTAMPNITAGGFTIAQAAAGGGGSAAPRNYVDPQWGGAANASWIKGKHTIKFGGEIKRLMMNHYEDSTPIITFTGGQTALAPAAPNNFNAFGDYLLGNYNAAQSEAMDPMIGQTVTPQNEGSFRPATLRGWQFGSYVSDQIQLTKKMSVSLGLRYEYYPLVRRADRGLEVFNFTTNQLDICGVAGNSPTCGITVQHLLFSPRLGWAYRLNDTLVIRAGYSRNPENDDSATAQMPPGAAFPVTNIVTIQAPNSYSTVGNLSQGVPIVPVFNLDVASVTPDAAITTYRGEFKRGEITSYNVTVQKLLPHNHNLTLGYVATHSDGLTRTENLNYGTLGGGTASQPYYQILGISGSVGVQTNLGHSQFDSFQASLTRRFSNGIQYTAAYTFSKNIDWWAGSIPQPQYWALNKGVASINTPNSLNATLVYDLPFGTGKHLLAHSGALSRIVGGWQINGFLNARSGLPFTVTSSAASLNAGTGTSQTAEQVLPNVQILGGIGSTQPWFNVLAYRPVTTVAFGNSGYNQLYGPHQINLDSSVFRDFSIREKMKLQFRIEALNTTNTPHFANPAANVSNLQLNSDGTIKNLNGFGVITSTIHTGREYDEREIELSARFSF